MEVEVGGVALGTNISVVGCFVDGRLFLVDVDPQDGCRVPVLRPMLTLALCWWWAAISTLNVTSPANEFGGNAATLAGVIGLKAPNVVSTRTTPKIPMNKIFFWVKFNKIK